jgi:hypothetical protein
VSGPQKLGAILARWSPGGGARGADPAAAVAVAWADAVGADIARRTRAGQIRDGVLTVYTAGSTWNHQLSFLAPAILSSLARACPSSGVKRLRFVVASGRTKALLDGAAAATAKHAHRIAASPSHETDEGGDREPDLGSLLQRLRRRQRALDRERGRAGWVRCTSCHAWRERRVGESADCAVCRDARRRAIDGRVERVISDAPWLSSAEVAEHVTQAGDREYARARRRLLTRWEEQLDEARRRLNRDALAPADRIVAWSYLMLRCRSPKADIGRALVVDLLGADWAAQLIDARTAARQAPSGARENNRKTTARVLQRRGARHV